MKFSWFHLPTFFQEIHGSEAQFYQDMLEETDRAEALGFHAVWCAEHHFYDYGGHIPSVPVLGSAIARIRATGITNIGLIGNFGSLDRTKILASLDRFAKYVMPRVKRNK